MRKIILIGMLFLGLVLFISGCEKLNIQGNTEVYIENYRLEPSTVIPNEEFNLIYDIKNPTEADRTVFLEITVSNNVERVSASYNRINIGDIKSKTSKSFFNKFRVRESEDIQKITLKLFSTESSTEPIYIKEIPIEVAISAR